MDKDRSLCNKVCNKVIDFIYDGFNSNNYDFLICKFNDFIYVEFIINNMIFIYSKNVIKI